MNPSNNPTDEELERIKKAAGAEARRELLESQRFHPFTFTELMLKKFPPAKFIVDRLVPAQSVTVLSGNPGTYKTWVLLHIALSVSSGEPVFGTFEATKTPVLIIDEENKQDLLQSRSELLTQKRGCDIHFISRENFKLTEEDINYLCDYCQQYGVGLVILDSFISVSGVSDENDASKIRLVFERLKPLYKQNMSVLIAHHNNKRSSDGNLAQAMRGSSDILAAIDSHIAVTREDKLIELTQTKSRATEELKPFSVRVESSDSSFKFEYLGESESGKSKRAEVREAILATVGVADNPPHQLQIYEEIVAFGVDVSPKTYNKIINEMVKHGELGRKHGDKRKWLYFLVKNE